MLICCRRISRVNAQIRNFWAAERARPRRPAPQQQLQQQQGEEQEGEEQLEDDGEQQQGEGQEQQQQQQHGAGQPGSAATAPQPSTKKPEMPSAAESAAAKGWVSYTGRYKELYDCARAGKPHPVWVKVQGLLRDLHCMLVYLDTPHISLGLPGCIPLQGMQQHSHAGRHMHPGLLSDSSSCLWLTYLVGVHAACHAVK